MAKNKIMVVDDSITDFHYAKVILEKGGYEVTHAPSGKDAIELAKTVLPDCIVMDVVMPEMNGFQATRAIGRNQETEHIPVIVLSSKSEQTDKVWAQRQGAIAYLVKPADPKKLLLTVKAVLERN